MNNIVCGIVACMSCGLVASCSGEASETTETTVADTVNDASDIGATKQPISYGNNYCQLWDYDEDWHDPENPKESHVVAFFYCADYFASPLYTYSTVEFFGTEKNWMIWGPYPAVPYYEYLVFVNGWDYYYRRWILNQSANYIFSNLEFY